MLEVQLAYHEVECGLAAAIGGVRDRELIHIGDGGDASGDGDKFWGTSGLLEEWVHGLEEDQGTDSVDLEMAFHFLSGCGDAGTPMVGDAGVGDHNIEVRNAML